MQASGVFDRCDVRRCDLVPSFRSRFVVPEDHRELRCLNRVWHGIERRYFAIPHGPYYTWGATARILRMFCDVMGGHDEAVS